MMSHFGADFYSGVDNTIWTKTASLNIGRTRQHNIVFVASGPKGIARCGVKALCIYTANKNYEGVRRRDFLIDLSLTWMKPPAQRRLDNKQPRGLVFQIKDFLGIAQAETTPTTSAQTPNRSIGRCHDCGRSRNKSTRKLCNTCKKFICGDHSRIVCLSCLENMN